MCLVTVAYDTDFPFMSYMKYPVTTNLANTILKYIYLKNKKK